MKSGVWLALLIIPLLAAVSAAAPQTADANSESYAIYSLLLPQIPSVPEKKFLIATDTLSYPDTRSRFPVEPENLVTKEEFDKRLANATPDEWRTIRRSQPCVLAQEAERDVYRSAMMDYRRNNELAVRLERRLDLPGPYELVDVSELVGKKKSERWVFAGKNGGHGVYELSAVGFSSDMTLAIVYVGYDCTWCSRWAVHILKKTNGMRELSLEFGAIRS